MKSPPRFSFFYPSLVSLGAALILQGPALAQITVTTLTDQNDTPAGPEISLREAIRESADGGQITLDPSLAGGALVLMMEELAVTGKTVSILAPGGLVIDGRGLSRLFNISGAGAGLNLTGVTLQHGRPFSGNGGAILSTGTLTLTDCVLRDNRAPAGFNGTAGIPGDQVNINGGGGGPGGTGGSGGAIFNTGNFSALRCQFIDNAAGDAGNGGNGGNASSLQSIYRGGVGGPGGQGGSGGAIVNQGPLQLTGCFFSGNVSGIGGNGGSTGEPAYRVDFGSNGGTAGSGGAVSQGGGNLIVDRCTFSGNRCFHGGIAVQSQVFLSPYLAYPGNAGSGAAIFCEDGVSAVMTNSTFTANQLEAGGGFASPGGGTIRGSPLRLVHCTVIGNTAVFSTTVWGNNWSLPPTSGIASLGLQCENCIVAGNTLGANGSVPQFAPIPALEIPANSPGTTPGVNLQVLQLGPLSITSGSLPVFIPGAASPVINAGANLSDPLAIDQRGLPRPVGAPDLGAVEVQAPEPALLTPQVITFSPPEVAPASSVTLTASVVSGLPVSLAVVSGPATLNGNVLTFADPGFVAVKASQSGDATRAPALPVVRIIGNLTAHTIPFTPPANFAFYTGSQTTVTLPATTSAGLPVTWTLLGAPAQGFSLTGNILVATRTGSVQIRGRNPGDAQHPTLDLTWTLSFVSAAQRWVPPLLTINWFTFVEGSSHGTPLTAILV